MAVPVNKSLANSDDRPSLSDPSQEAEPDFSARDGPFRTLTDLIRARAREPGLKDQPILSYPSCGTAYVDYTLAQLDELADKAACFYGSLVPGRKSSAEPAQVVALLGPSTLAYFITLLALSRLGHTVLFLSPRLSEEAYVSLLRTTGASVVLVDESLEHVGSKVLAAMRGIVIGKLGTIEDFVAMGSVAQGPEVQLDPAHETRKIAYIVHSSGSTILPRSNYVTHAAALGNSSSPVRLVGFVTLPLFHMWGLGCVFRSIMNRKRLYMYNAHLPLTAQHLASTLAEHADIQVLYTVPYALKLLAESEQHVELLARLEAVMVGGSACPKPVGDQLARAGVMLVTHLGSTETGQLMSSARPRDEVMEWDWLRPSPALTPYLRMEPQEDQQGVFEMVILDGWPSKVASNRDDGSYATKDLYERHPDWPRKNAWRYYARKDDTIVLSNGEKANPLLLEGAAKQSHLVSEAVVCGAQRLHLVMLLARAESVATDGEVVASVWPSVEEANAAVPAFARLSKDMIRVLPSDAAARIRTTDKGSLIRSAFNQDFQEVIDAMYDDEIEKQGDLSLNLEDLRAWLIIHIREILPLERKDALHEETDVFSLGVDSLQASRIRSEIVRHLDVGPGKLGANFVFEHSSVAAMASELDAMRVGGAEAEKVPNEERMQILIERYSAFERLTPVAPTAAPKQDCIVVTGATGSLGAHVVAQLAALGRTARIVCLVRAGSDAGALRRVEASLRERRLIVDVARLEFYASDFSQPSLGLKPAVYDSIVESLTSVIHSAWSVNFNLALHSFEQDCIRGTKHLLDLCLASRRPAPATMNFCSSISAVGKYPGAEVLEELPESLSYAQRMGYAQSKLVAEHICWNAARATGMTVRILRIGQIIGDTQHGIWNTQEAIPMILQSATTIGALPALDERSSWLPVDIVATSLLELSLSTVVGTDVFHLVNPRMFHWEQDLLPMLSTAGLEFETLPSREWLQRLRSKPDPEANPPYRLLDFFAAKYDRVTAGCQKTFICHKAFTAAPALTSAPVLDQEAVTLVLHHLRERWSGGAGA